MSKEFTIYDFLKDESNICINCETEEQVSEFCVAMDKLRNKWDYGENYLHTVYYAYGNATCYTWDRVPFDKDTAINNGFVIYKWEDVRDKFAVPVIEIDEKEKSFTKSDLENGMVVELRNGEKRIVVNDRLLGLNSWNSFKSYDDNLTNCYDLEYDICSVYKGENIYSLKVILEEGYGLEEIWKRKEPVTFTIKEAEEKLRELLGEEVKIG